MYKLYRRKCIGEKLISECIKYNISNNNIFDYMLTLGCNDINNHTNKLYNKLDFQENVLYIL